MPVTSIKATSTYIKKLRTRSCDSQGKVVTARMHFYAMRHSKAAGTVTSHRTSPWRQLHGVGIGFERFLRTGISPLSRRGSDTGRVRPNTTGPARARSSSLLTRGVWLDRTVATAAVRRVLTQMDAGLDIEIMIVQISI